MQGGGGHERMMEEMKQTIEGEVENKQADPV